ncbi:hypothetical protein F5Y14DRAFT_414504 [Nemania sp. NC0429]|nr:hypothetical protein F5Y14DRAFT_414504 [Nemania sp. NC0429]
MAPIHDPVKEFGRPWVLQRLEQLYKDMILDGDGHDTMSLKMQHNGDQGSNLYGPNQHDPSITIPRILLYLRDNDAGRDANWNVNFPLIRRYLSEAHREMVTGGLGFSDSNLRAALEDARVMVNVHLKSEKLAQKTSPWTTDILRGQTTQERLLTYPQAFPLPQPDRAKSRYRPVKPVPRPNNKWHVWNAKSPSLAEIDNYVESENRYFQALQQSAMTGRNNETAKKTGHFDIENQAYEEFMSYSKADICSNAPPKEPNNSDGTRDPSFYRRRGWQRAALQQCLNLFASHENRVINTPWRRPVLPYDPPAPLPKEIPYVPRLVDPSQVIDEKQKDPFSWLYWSSEYTRIVNFLAECQRQRYIYQSSTDFSSPALPANFRGPRIYRGLAIYDQHWLKIGEYLESLESLFHSAWGAAPRPLLRAVLRDIDAGKQSDTGGPNINDGHFVAAEDDDDAYDRRRYWRPDIKRRLGIDNQEDNTNDDNFKLIDDFDIAWLRYLCEPSRTLEMCDPTKQPVRNLAIIFDSKLQSYFRDLTFSGAPNSNALHIWAEDDEDVDSVIRSYKPNTLRTVVAYINGCTESEVKDSGNTNPNPQHPNACYQFSLEEAEFLCIELHQLGRCVYIPKRDGDPARVDRPAYNVHPEDRVMWRYTDLRKFSEYNSVYVDDMVDHYDTTYGHWSLYHGDRPRFSRDLEYMIDHAGSKVPPEIERVEIQEKHPSTEAALARRRAIIKRYLVPEGLCHIGEFVGDSIEYERDSPYRNDLAAWEVVGEYLTSYHKHQKEQHKPSNYYYSTKPYEPQTPERTVQFFRNLAYRMGRTMRYVEQIKGRLQYLEDDPGKEISRPLLDLSADLKEPRPENEASVNTISAPVIVEKWWRPISARDYDLAIERWSTAVREGSGEVALMPPDINEVLAKADPDSSSQNPLKGEQDPFTVIREGIIEDCFQNRPTMYPGRLGGFKDQADKEYQGYERPSLFDWATKDQRRYQAPHTRKYFFNMQRWPPSHILPHRLDAIRERKDEVSRRDPSKTDQAYGILTYRVPRGKEKPVYARPLIDHHREPDNPWSSNLNDIVIDNHAPSNPFGNSLLGNNDDSNNSNGDTNNLLNDTNIPTDNNPFGSNIAGNNTTTSDNNMVAVGTKRKAGMRKRGARQKMPAKQGFVPFTQSDEKFAPGPAVFPMGDTLLQKVLISHELSNALFPPVPFYKEPFFGLPKVWKKLVGVEAPLIPLVPPVARSNIPRSNPQKRKMPIEFLNNRSTKKFRSDVSAPLQPGGNGGQFAAATVVKAKARAKAKVTPDSEQDTDAVPVNISPGAYSDHPKAGIPEGVAQPQPAAAQPVTHDQPVTASSDLARNFGPMMQFTEEATRPPLGGGVTGGSSQGVYIFDPKTGSVTGQAQASTTIGSQTKEADKKTSLYIQRMGQSTGNIAGKDTTTPIIGDIPGQNVPWSAQFDKKSSTPTSLPAYEDPSKKEAKRRLTLDFPHGMVQAPTEVQHLFASATLALEFSINRQMGKYNNLQTTNQNLSRLARAVPALQPYVQMGGLNNFDVHCLALLAEVFGETNGLKIQLGITQEQPNDKGQMKLVPYLMGSKYNDDTDKIIVWVRLVQLDKYHGGFINAYNKQPYNCYKGIGLRETW